MSVQDSTTSTTIDPTKFSVSSSDVTETTVKLNWELPSEDELIASGLSYSVYYTDDSEVDFSSVDNIIAKGTLGVSDLKTLSTTISMLEAGTEYRFNIIVKDSSGEKYCYKPIKVQTKTA